VIGRTELPGADGKPAGPGCVRLKLTLVNPEATPDDLDRLLDLIAAAGAAEDQPS
jgi:L-2,4-diaminobutyrate decarboxylase